MSCAHLPWLSTGSTLRPSTLAPRLANSPSSPATAPSSVVQTGVKSLGCENSTAQPSPIHSWKWMGPCVVSAVKSGAVSLIRRDICVVPAFSFVLDFGSGLGGVCRFGLQAEDPPGLALGGSRCSLRDVLLIVSLRS